jgi:putative endonuclease
MMASRKSLGRWGEAQAAAYLAQCGYEILDWNARTSYGEIDLVARQEGVTVFVEVKTRSSEKYGLPEESITPRKRAHILAAAQAYLQNHPELDLDWRVDVVAIRRQGQGRKPEIIHFENAIES